MSASQPNSPSKQESRQRQSGFTLIELLVVVVVLGILAAIVVFAVRGVGDKGKEKACRTDTRALETALESYFAQNGVYVASDTLPDPAGWPPDGFDPSGADESALVAAGFLSESSDYHYVSNVMPENALFPGSSADYTVRVQDPACGELNGGVQEFGTNNV